MNEARELAHRPLPGIAFLPRRLLWSPDGSALLAAAHSPALCVLSGADLSARLSASPPAPVTAAAWYPLMSAGDPASCAFAAVCPQRPIALIDSRDGRVRARYRCCAGDSTAALTSLLFSGGALLAGGTRALFACDIARPDRCGAPVVRCAGSVLSVAASPACALVSAGLSTGELLAIDIRAGECVMRVRNHAHGVDAQCWDGARVLTAARLEDDVFCVDMRAPAVPSHLLRTVRRSSRFVALAAADGRVAVGSEGGPAAVYDAAADFAAVARVGSGPTPLCDVARGGEVCAASGAFRLVVDEESGEAVFGPQLDACEVYGVVRNEE